MTDIIVQIGENEHEASFVKNEPSNIVVNGNKYEIELLKEIAPNIHSLSVNNKVYQIEFDLDWDGISTIYLDGLDFEFAITDETKKLLKEFIKQAGGSLAEGVTQIKAPMPGMIVKVQVEEGQKVSKDDPIIIVEAMKMENAIKAPAAGIVNNIAVDEGQAVEKDALLMEIHAE